MKQCIQRRPGVGSRVSGVEHRESLVACPASHHRCCRPRLLAIRLLAVCCLLLPAALSLADAPETFDDAIRLAREQFFRQRDREAGRATAARAAALAETPDERFAAAMLEGELAVHEREFDQARAAYRRVLDEAEAPTAQQARALRAMAATWIRERDFPRAHALYDAVLALPDLPLSIRADVLLNQGDAFRAEQHGSAARENYAMCLELDNLPARQAFNAWRGIAMTRLGESDAAGMAEAMDNAFRQEGGFNAGQQAALLRDYALLLTAEGQPTEAAAAWGRIVDLPEAPERTYREAVFARLDRLAEAQRGEAAAVFALGLETDERLTPGQRFRAGLIRVGLRVGPETAAFASALDELAGRFPVAAEPEETEALTVEQRVAALDEAGKFFMRRENYPVVRRLLEAAAALHRPPVQNTLECRFVERAPRDVSDWLRSDLFRSPENRSDRFFPYNQAAARLLVNDVGQAQRDDVVVADDVPEGAETILSMAADDAGWHVFVQCNDPEAEAVLAGLLGGDRLEMFFRPGDRGAYYQWFVAFPHTAEPTTVTWDSPHRHYRRMEDYVRVQTAETGSGFGAYVFFPWEMLYDNLPQNGDRWPFSLQRWSRLGSTTWGGKVHELNRFGRVIWRDLTPEREQAIRRGLALRAWTRYRNVRNRLVRHWRDEVMGDPAFYEQALKPAVERLDAAGEGIEQELAGADIDQLFNEAVPDWMEFDYRVAELRSAWLLDQHFQQP